MARDKKVISLDERRGHPPRRHRAAPSPGSGSAPEGGPPPEEAGGPAAPDDRAAGERAGGAARDTRPLPGRLIWLYCPTCGTIEYTELDMAGGRVHNACGTTVQEAPVELDLRAEATIAHINLERLTILESLLAGQRKRYEEYLQRLSLAAGRPVEPYPVRDENATQLPVADVDAFGLLVSRFFHDPAAHFPELAAQREEPGAPKSDPED